MNLFFCCYCCFFGLFQCSLGKYGERMGTNESSSISQQASSYPNGYTMSPSLCFSSFFFQSQFEKQAGGHTFDVLKVDSWRVLTLHSTLKIEEGAGRGGGKKTELLNSFSLSSSGCRPSSGLQQSLLMMQCCQVADF